MKCAPRPGENLRPRARFSLGWLALACGLVPLLAVHASYLISASQGLVPWCFPYLDGCTSISRAARFGLANHLFKGLMLPSAVLIGLFWMGTAQWLASSSPSSPKRNTSIAVIGVIGAAFLILYATFLGVQGDIYQWLRRYGVTIYFSFTVLAQMLLASVLARGGLQRLLGAICALMLLLGLVSLPLQHVVEHRDAALNAIEWCYALLMTSSFTIIGIAWLRQPDRPDED